MMAERDGKVTSGIYWIDLSAEHFAYLTIYVFIEIVLTKCLSSRHITGKCLNENWRYRRMYSNNLKALSNAN